MLPILPNNLEMLLKTIGSDWGLYNIKKTIENNNTIVKIGSAPMFNGTIKFVYDKVADEISFHGNILTDEKIYNRCLKLINKFKNSSSYFQPTNQDFYNNLGVNGMINFRINIEEENINSIYDILDMNEFKRKM